MTQEEVTIQNNRIAKFHALKMELLYNQDLAKKLAETTTLDLLDFMSRHNLVLMDNNILAAGDYAVEQLNKIIERGYRVDFNQALDARLVTDEFAQLLAKVKWLDSNRIRFGCDTHAQIKDCERAIELLEHYGFRGQFFLYTMIGGKNDLEECYSRINHWRQRMLQAREKRDRCYTYPHAQPYRDPLSPHHTVPKWQQDLAQWTNKKMVFVACDFKEFSPRKGFTCKEYF